MFFLNLPYFVDLFMLGDKGPYEFLGQTHSVWILTKAKINGNLYAHKLLNGTGKGYNFGKRL